MKYLCYAGDSAAAEALLLRIMDWRSINARGSNANKLPGVLFATGIDALRINAEYGLVHVEMGRWPEAIDTLKDVLPGKITMYMYLSFFLSFFGSSWSDVISMF